MKTVSVDSFERRRFLAGTSALGAAALLGTPGRAAAEPPPEITRIRISAAPAICAAPQFAAAPLLEAEGFNEVEYVPVNTGPSLQLASGAYDLTMDALGPALVRIDAGDPIVMVAGIHLGCYELFGGENVHAVRDLKGKRIPVDGFGGPQHVFLSSMVAYLGLDPRKDIQWIEAGYPDGMKLFIDGKADAYLGFPPEPQELRARKIGRVLVNMSTDKPWSQYYCCFLMAHRDFVKTHPVATKRALRAILKAADLCVEEPERMARLVTDKGFTSNYDYALDAIKQVPYNVWRTYDPVSSLRFYSVRLHELGMLKSTPQKLIAQGTDFQFLNQLKRELKA
jgi:NitT/TauT family transport system substrate-binding protein